MLTTVYKPADNTYGNIKAIIREEDTEHFIDNGFYRTVGEFPSVTEKPVVKNGDKGSGKPGTIEWHTSWIDSFKTKKEVLAHVKDVTGKEACSSRDASRKRLPDLKTYALSKISEYLDDNS